MPPRRNVAGGVEHRRLGSSGALGDRGDLHFDWPLARQPLPAEDTCATQQRQQNEPLQLSPDACTIGPALDLQRGQIVLQIAHPALPFVSVTTAVPHASRASRPAPAVALCASARYVTPFPV